MAPSSAQQACSNLRLPHGTPPPSSLSNRCDDVARSVSSPQLAPACPTAFLSLCPCLAAPSPPPSPPHAQARLRAPTPERSRLSCVVLQCGSRYRGLRSFHSGHTSSWRNGGHPNCHHRYFPRLAHDWSSTSARTLARPRDCQTRPRARPRRQCSMTRKRGRGSTDQIRWRC